jgi:hypothetical protein
MVLKIKIVLFLAVLLASTSCTRVNSVSSKVLKIRLIGDVVEGDWMQINDYRIEFILPDKNEASPKNPSYNSYVLKTSESDPHRGYISPSMTYEIGPGKPILMPVPKGIVLTNITRILSQLSYNEYEGQIFEFKTDVTTTLQGLLIMAMYSGDEVKISFPEGMQIAVEPVLTDD